MEKEITKVAPNMYHINSQPGDGTRYDYFCYREGDHFCFMPCDSSFRYPQRLNIWHVKDLEDLELSSKAQGEFCNPWTLKECIRTMKEILEFTKKETKKEG